MIGGLIIIGMRTKPRWSWGIHLARCYNFTTSQ